MPQLFKKAGNKLECLLCPHYCKLSPGKSGICLARINSGEKIELLTYGVLSAYSLDPIEKKPLYHFFPGYDILSIGSYGCNMKCDFCQNFNISQNIPGHMSKKTTPGNIVAEALSLVKNIGIAFTYNEPVIWYEFMRDVATSAKSSGLHTVMISNGYVNSEPLNDIIQFIDAFNIDLKAFNNDFYRKLTGSEIGPVKKSLKQIAKSGKHLEITSLIIPGQNDNEKELALQSEWIAGELGKEVPVHLSRYFPVYKRDNPATSQESMKRLFEIVSKYSDNVYMGNIVSDRGQNTFCSNCGKIVTKRSGYKTELLNLNTEGKCSNCGTMVFKYFTISPLTQS
jgi:pyruvate formate lyase activating enzyme